MKEIVLDLNGVFNLKQFIGSIIKDKKLRIRFIILLIILVYLPIVFNILIIYNKTIRTIKNEKIESSTQILYKLTQSVEYNLTSIENTVGEVAKDNALGASLYRYEGLEKYYQDKLDAFYKKKITSIEKENTYIDRMICLADDKIYYSSDDSYNINIKEFLQSEELSRLNNSKEYLIWDYSSSKRSYIQNYNDDSLLIIHKIKYEIPDYIVNKRNINNENTNINVGYILSFVNIGNIQSLYKDIPSNEYDNISIYRDGKPIFNDDSIVYEFNNEINNFINSYSTDESSIKFEEVNIKNNEYLLGISKLNTVDRWNIVTLELMDKIIGETKKSLLNSFIILAIIGVIISLWIILEILFFSKLITQKEMANYRLEAIENMNNKLRVYKHDFTNHLQIIHSLLEMGKPDRAKKYLSNVIDEGRIMNSNYEIGVPEIEATVYSAINKAKKKGIKVEVDSIELSEDFSVNIYDLSKILSNLLKNAIQALEKSNGKEKLLKINIYNELNEYVFEIYNNKPEIPINMRENIFNKGISTNNDKDRGLGLYIVKKLVEKNNGTINLIVDNGNYFIVKFPIEQ